MSCALYLPVLLASLCYSLRLGLADERCDGALSPRFSRRRTSAGQAVSLRAVAIGFSFPVVAIFGGALRAQMENRVSPSPQ